MLLGDGMTTKSCYPQLLSQEFGSRGGTNLQFVGTNQVSQSCNGAPAVPTEAHDNYRVTSLVTNNPPASGTGSLSQLQGWAAENPDIVLMDLGTNDAHAGISTASILSALLFVTNQFRGQNPDVIFFISKVHPVSNPGWESSVVALNAQITDTWAANNSTAMSPIYIIDQWTGFDAGADTIDGATPDMSGSQKMADKAYAAVSARNYF
jgi:lysophospholipase L1-like esterase